MKAFFKSIYNAIKVRRDLAKLALAVKTKKIEKMDNKDVMKLILSLLRNSKETLGTKYINKATVELTRMNRTELINCATILVNQLTSKKRGNK